MSIGNFVPIFLMLVAFAIIFLLLLVYKMSKKGRRSPLTRQLLRSPGEALRTQIEDLGFDAGFYFMTIMFVPVLMYSIFLTQKLSGAKASLLVFFVLTFIPMMFIVFKLWKLLKLRSNLWLGLDCEMAVGQELNQLMLEGCRVYHDFPAENFNIDHVVVGPGGVYAVETKGRGKPDKKMEGKEATVTYNGQTLNFPGWTETEPIDQARWQAEWLSKWLTSAVGEDISVQPVLSFPGWYVNKEKKDDLIFLYGKPTFLAHPFNNKALPTALIQRIAHQLEQRCRDVEPVAYSKKAKGK